MSKSQAPNIWSVLKKNPNRGRNFICRRATKKSNKGRCSGGPNTTERRRSSKEEKGGFRVRGFHKKTSRMFHTKPCEAGKPMGKWNKATSNRGAGKMRFREKLCFRSVKSSVKKKKRGLGQTPTGGGGIGGRQDKAFHKKKCKPGRGANWSAKKAV